MRLWCSFISVNARPSLGNRRGTRRPPVQERNIERWIPDRDRRELETRRNGWKPAELVGRRGEPLIGVRTRSHDLHRRRDRLAHRDRAVTKLVGELVCAKDARRDEGHEERPRHPWFERPDRTRALLHGAVRARVDEPPAHQERTVRVTRELAVAHDDEGGLAAMEGV